MSILDETQFVERLRFFNGQLLTAPDLQGIDDFNREMRWLHNASLHQPGIGSGFAVSGNKGDREVTIKPGYALDDRGREIVLTHEHTEPVPAAAADSQGGSLFYSLTVSYPADAALEPAETREVICNPGQSGVVRLREVPVFCWVQLGSATGLPVDPQAKSDILGHRKIVLAQIEVFNCQLKQPVSLVRRCNAKPECGPHICCGSMRLTGLNFTDQRRICRLPLLLFDPFEVPTDEAAFLTVPHYFAHIEGSPLVTIPDLEGSQEVTVLYQLLIEKQARDSFTAHLMVFPLMNMELFNNPASDAFKGFTSLIQDQWRLVWMGVEP